MPSIAAALARTRRGVTRRELLHVGGLGFAAVEDRVHVHDSQAKVLHLLGLDRTKRTFRFQGRDFRLTDVYGEVATKLLA